MIKDEGKFTMSMLLEMSDVIKRNSIDPSKGLYYSYNRETDYGEVIGREQLQKLRPDLTDEFLDNINYHEEF
jgi:hypothetical protein